MSIIKKALAIFALVAIVESRRKDIHKKNKSPGWSTRLANLGSNVSSSVKASMGVITEATKHGLKRSAEIGKAAVVAGTNATKAAVGAGTKAAKAAVVAGANATKAAVGAGTNAAKATLEAGSKVKKAIVDRVSNLQNKTKRRRRRNL